MEKHMGDDMGNLQFMGIIQDCVGPILVKDLRSLRLTVVTVPGIYVGIHDYTNET